MLIMIKSQNPDKEYPSNLGQPWTNDEEILLLEALNKNIDIETIAKSHKRTIGGINSRRREIANKMYSKNISMEEIIKQTKLDYNSIKKTIDRKQNRNSKETPKIIKIKTPIPIESEISEMKNDIKDLKNTIKELVEMMKAVYEFEDT